MKRRRTQINLLGAWVDSITHEEALETILMWCGTRARQYVVTPNLDHCRLLRGDCDFSSAYEQSGLSVPDGWPLVAASRITRYPIRRRVTGADLVIPLCRALAANSFSVFLLGSSHEVLKASSEKLLQAAPGLAIRGILFSSLRFRARQAATRHNRRPYNRGPATRGDRGLGGSQTGIVDENQRAESSDRGGNRGGRNARLPRRQATPRSANLSSSGP